MNGQLLHPTTALQIKQLLQRPTQTVLLVGPVGSGSLLLSQQLAETVLGLEANSLTTYPYAKILAPESGKALGIEAIRELEQFLSLKVPRQADYNRVVIIDQADTLTKEAQNALLKTLEEPPLGTIIILASANQQSLLPTVRSRTQTVTVKRPTKDQIIAFFSDKGFSIDDINQSYAVSGGLTELMQALLENGDHPLVQATEQARILLRQSAYERLAAIDALLKQKQLAYDTLSILQQMAHISLQTASANAAKRWQTVLQASYEAQSALAGNAQPKLVLTNLMLML